MKKLMMIVALMLVSVSAYAENTGTTFFHNHTIPDSAFVDKDTQRQDFGYGVGADVVVFKSGSNWIEEITVEPRYDIELRETRVFGVVRVDLWDALTDK